MTWEQICKDKRFEDAPYKVETNAQGQIILSQNWNYHGSHSFRISAWLEKLMPKGTVTTGCAVETADGTKEADVAWLSPGRGKQVAEDFSCKIAPEICVEVLSPSNTMKEMLYKKDLYFGAGALEYWLCDKAGNLRFFNVSGELSKSKLAPKVPLRLPETLSALVAEDLSVGCQRRTCERGLKHAGKLFSLPNNRLIRIKLLLQRQPRPKI